MTAPKLNPGDRIITQAEDARLLAAYVTGCDAMRWALQHHDPKPQDRSVEIADVVRAMAQEIHRLREQWRTRT
jgi:hypothetical protein